jgi:DNA polymerase III alpha subunit (gram-positive type)
VAVTDPARPPADLSADLPVFSVIDIETSGLSTRWHRILQLAVARVVDGEIVDEWSSLVKLRWPWQRVGPRRVHGIGRRSLKGAPDMASVLAEFAHRTDGTVIVAHNMAFDWTFLERAAARHGIGLDRSRRLCTLWLSRRLDPDRQRSHRLSDLCERYGIVNERPHDAVYDARSTALVLPHLLAAHEITDETRLAGYYER